MHSFLSYTHKILNDVDIEIKKWNAAGNKYTLYEMKLLEDQTLVLLFGIYVGYF